MSSELKHDLLVAAGHLATGEAMTAEEESMSVPCLVEKLIGDIEEPVPPRLVLFATILARHIK